MFDYIIIDAPPLGIFSDASVLMQRADGGIWWSGPARLVTRQSTSFWTNAGKRNCWVWC
jgi:Mrp family chromosome partitioning ATPase